MPLMWSYAEGYFGYWFCDLRSFGTVYYPTASQVIDSWQQQHAIGDPKQSWRFDPVRDERVHCFIFGKFTADHDWPRLNEERQSLSFRPLFLYTGTMPDGQQHIYYDEAARWFKDPYEA